MQKKLVPKAPTKKEILSKINESDLDFLLDIEGLEIELCEETIEDSNDWKNALENCELETENNILVVKYGEASIQAKFLQQPSCCANIIVYDFQGAIHGIDGQIVTWILFKVLQILAQVDGYSFVWFTHVKNTEYVKNALAYGFTTTRTYLNTRTSNTLVDLHLEV